MKYSIRLLLNSLFILCILCACEKKEVPTVTTSEVTNITETTATCGGTIISEGSGTVLSRGVCWSTETDPSIENDKTSDGAGAGTFTSNITGLTDGTQYYVRAYATNNAGTGYGMAMSFTTTNCEYCRIVTTDNVTGEVTYGFETLYCGETLQAIKAHGSTTVGNITSEWECHEK